MDSTDIDNSLEYNMNRYEEGVDELADINSGMFSQDNLLSENEEEEEEDPDDVIILHMDIREPLSHLKVLLEDKVDVDLANFEFTLQDAQILEPHKNLVDQCLKGEGLVQINVQVRANKQRINVVDVLKPTDDALAEVSGQTVKVKKEKTVNIDMELELTGDSTRMDEDEMANWVIDTQFQKDQTRLKIPEDPVQWTQMQVKYWLQWAIKQFQLSNIKLQEWAFSGKQLCSLSLDDFHARVPDDPGDMFWTHLELLRKCKFVAVRQDAKASGVKNENSTPRMIIKNQGKKTVKPVPSLKNEFANISPSNNRTGNNGQIQLWQFLLEILTDKNYKDIIKWNGGNGEFKLCQPEVVAYLWGVRKNKPSMNYEKLSRALRYYYDGDMISKVHGKRFVYKFVCNLKQLLGYDAQELSDLVNE